ncbi:MAG: hypothetical protein HY714_02860 [Candidatus Omnitrophica bacterium]|nr:hypothetical protein [Candidatus Omnitrophota bacterium]
MATIDIKPTLQFSILCDDIRREDNGKFMFLGLFETIGGLRFPLKHPKLYIADRWCKGVGDFTEKIRVIQEETGATLIQSKENSFELKSIDHYHTSINRFDGIVFPDAGKYFVEILLNGDLVIAYPIILTVLKN